MMRILEITGEPIASGGQEMFIANVLRHINMDNLQIDVLTPYYCDNDVYRNDIESRGGRLICFGLPFHPGTFRSNIIRPLNDFLHQNKYDAVHAHSGSITILALSALVARWNGTRKIIVHSHCTGTTKNVKYRLLKWFSYPILRFIPSNYCACSVAAGEWKFPSSIVKKRLNVINNGIDLNLFSPNSAIRQKIREQLGLHDDTLIIGHVGRFSTQKNHEFIISLFDKLKKKRSDCKLMLVGDGELMEQSMNEVSDRGLQEDVIFIGRVDNVQDYVQAMDVFVFPSLWEGLGLVGVEAQGVGVPVIASTNVPWEMKLTSDVTYLGLDNVNEWVDKVLEVSTHKRGDNVDEIRRKGYDINQTAEEIRGIYMSN